MPPARGAHVEREAPVVLTCIQLDAAVAPRDEKESDGRGAPSSSAETVMAAVASFQGVQLSEGA